MPVPVHYRWKPEYVKMLRGYFAEHPEDRRADTVELLNHLTENSPGLYRAIVAHGPTEAAFMSLVVQAGGWRA